MEGYPAITKDPWAGGIQVEDVGGKELPDAGKYKDVMKSDIPFHMPEMGTIMSAPDAFKFVLANAGATLPVRDAVDMRIVQQVRTGRIDVKEMKTDTDFQFKVRKLPRDSYKLGIITAPWQVGGYPDYKGTPYKDSDNDGLPDAWEKAHGLNPKNSKDSALPAKNGHGYTNIEVFLNEAAAKGEKSLASLK